MAVLSPEVELHVVNVDTHSNTSPREFRHTRKRHEELWGCRKVSKIMWVVFDFETRSHFKAQPGLELTVA